MREMSPPSTRSWPTGLVCAIVSGWIALILLAGDAAGHAGAFRPLAMGSTWALLGVLLWRQRERVGHVAVVVCYAAVIEVVFSGVLEAYTYTEGLPGYVPPGHGLLYLAALDLGRLIVRLPMWRVLWTAVVVVLGACGFTGLLGRPDLLGALWAGCLLWFIWRGREQGAYAALLPLCLGLELLGVYTGAWSWEQLDPVLGVISIGNPPIVSAGGYVFLAAAATSWGPTLSRYGRASAGERAAPLPRQRECSELQPHTQSDPQPDLHPTPSRRSSEPT